MTPVERAHRRLIGAGYSFLEAPRWVGNRLWVTDIGAGSVLSMDLDGGTAFEAEGLDRPGGTGHLPDGALVVVSMRMKTLLRRDGDKMVVHCDLTPHMEMTPNDLWVGPGGHAYVSSPGFGCTEEQYTQNTGLVHVRPDGIAEMQPGTLNTPNGMAVLPDGRTLVVAETVRGRLTAFTIERDGRLKDQRVWAELGNEVWPDGICSDAEGAVWVADSLGHRCLRVREGGQVTCAVDTGALKCVAPVLGGPDGRTLVLLLCEEVAGSHGGTDDFMDQAMSSRLARIEALEVEVPGVDLR